MNKYNIIIILTIISILSVISIEAYTENVTLTMNETYIIKNNSIELTSYLLYNNEYKEDMCRSECELFVYDEEFNYIVDYQSTYNEGDGRYTYTLNNISNGSYFVNEYCHYGDILNYDKIYLFKQINITNY